MKARQTVQDFRQKLGTSPAWAERAIVRLWERQTADEQETRSTRHDNGRGFTGVDADILSSFAEQLGRGRHLSRKQLTLAFKKLPKYAGQLHRVAYGKA